jgi:hypothetical protein
MIRNGQGVGFEWAAFKARANSSDKSGMAQETRRPTGSPQQPLRQQMRRDIEKE